MSRIEKVGTIVGKLVWLLIYTVAMFVLLPIAFISLIFGKERRYEEGY
ncbi:MAG: hypothetical protein WAR39_01635 [Prevotella sp.]